MGDRRPNVLLITLDQFRRTEAHAYVQFGDGGWLSFDLAADPTWRTTTRDAGVALPLAQAMLQWRAEHTDRTLTGMLCDGGRAGRWPEMPTGRRS